MPGIIMRILIALAVAKLVRALIRRISQVHGHGLIGYPFRVRKRRVHRHNNAVGLGAFAYENYRLGYRKPRFRHTYKLQRLRRGNGLRHRLRIGKANVLRDGTDVAIFACGLMVNESLEAAKLLAADGIDAAVINIHTIKPIDRECVIHYAQRCSKVFTVEEHSTIGGLGDAVADVLMGVVNCGFHKIGVPDQFGQSGKAADVLKEYGLTAPQIAANIKAKL